MPVYFIQAGDNGPVKIGFSVAPEYRLVKMAADNPEPLRILGILENGDREAERQLHERFSAHRHKGEWFRPIAEIIEFAKAIPRRPPPVKQRRRRYPDTALGRYLDDHGLTTIAFAALAGTTSATVSRLAAGKLAPRRKLLERVWAATNGAVTANNFFDEWLARRNADGDKAKVA